MSKHRPRAKRKFGRRLAAVVAAVAVAVGVSKAFEQQTVQGTPVAAPEGPSSSASPNDGADGKVYPTGYVRNSDESRKLKGYGWAAFFTDKEGVRKIHAQVCSKDKRGAILSIPVHSVGNDGFGVQDAVFTAKVEIAGCSNVIEGTVKPQGKVHSVVLELNQGGMVDVSKPVENLGWGFPSTPQPQHHDAVSKAVTSAKEFRPQFPQAQNPIRPK